MLDHFVVKQLDFICFLVSIIPLATSYRYGSLSTAARNYRVLVRSPITTGAHGTETYTYTSRHFDDL